ncbi:hypothetical protein HDU96_002204 [Phlyctochytrium bullatum]|nr:hypothetical protein HDU96_002204 [Phlyctochytrium bullatum]
MDPNELLKKANRKFPELREYSLKALLQAKGRMLTGGTPLPKLDYLRNPYAVEHAAEVCQLETNKYFNISKDLADFLNVSEGVQLVKSKDMEAAIKKFTSAIEVDPSCAEAFVGRGAA